MATSSSIEIYFSVDLDRRPFTEPLLFQHIPGGPGLSFRNAAARFLGESGSAIIEIPKAKAAMKAAGDWPARFIGLYERLSRWAHIDAVLSQHTSVLADVVSAPILTILSDPDAFFAALVGSRAASVVRDQGTNRSIEDIVARLTNPQAKALVNTKIPPYPPSDQTEFSRLEAIAAKIAQRHMIFHADRYGAFAAYCQQTFGLDAAGSRDGAKREPPVADEARALIRDFLGDRDPVWFDRLVYDRTSSGSRSPPNSEREQR